LKAGVNRHGLVVVSATAPVPRQDPRFLLLADRHTVASVKIAPGCQLDIQTTETAVLSHTNRCVAAALRQYNPPREYQ